MIVLKKNTATQTALSEDATGGRRGGRAAGEPVAFVLVLELREFAAQGADKLVHQILGEDSNH